MAKYKARIQFNLVIALPLLLGAIYYFLRPPLFLMYWFAGAFAYSTFFMDPDPNCASQTRFLSVRGLPSLPFLFYAKCFSHFSFSRHPILGSITRIAWLLGWAGAIFFLIVHRTLPTYKFLLKFYKYYQPFILYSLAGICLADWGYLLLDMKKTK